MASTRYVRENADGGWDVVKEGHRRATVRMADRSSAVARARDIVRREGGGEVRVMNKMGKIVDSRTVAEPGTRSSNGRKRQPSRGRWQARV